MIKREELVLSQILCEALEQVHHQGNLGAIASGIATALRSNGILVTRLQLPISEYFGFKHPFYVGIIITWTLGEGVHVLLRERKSTEPTHGTTQSALKASPYGPLIFEGAKSVRHRPSADHPIELIRDLFTSGFKDYFAICIPLPDGSRQVMSLSTDAEEGFPSELETIISPLYPIIALCIYGAYQRNTSKQIAFTYLGEHTGKRVLEGELSRGNAETLSTLILFADVRNFTALSEQVGAKRVTDYVNQAFELLSIGLKPLGGEILKFIGDAALVIFPNRSLRSLTEQDLRRPTLDLKSILLELTHTIHQIRLIEVEGKRPLDLGVGLHIGEVNYGNMGAKDRLDFTVMGPAVNLASRLESLTKALSETILFSEQVYTELSSDDLSSLILKSHPPQKVKGVSGDVKVWGVRVNTH